MEEYGLKKCQRKCQATGLWVLGQGRPLVYRQMLPSQANLCHDALRGPLSSENTFGNHAKRGWIFRDFRNTLLISAVFTINNFGYRKSVQLWGWAALARYGRKWLLTTGPISSVQIYQSKETPTIFWVEQLYSCTLYCWFNVFRWGAT